MSQLDFPIYKFIDKLKNTEDYTGKLFLISLYLGELNAYLDNNRECTKHSIELSHLLNEIADFSVIHNSGSLVRNIAKLQKRLNNKLLTQQRSN